MNACPFCSRPWDQHTTRCEGGVPQVDLYDDRGLAGKVISGYRILGGIGKGGMGTVYLALDNITEGQLDAVKILNRDLLADRERLRREAVTANRVDHPNVCRIYNYVEAFDPDSSTALTLIAMELVRGPTLREVQEGAGGVLSLGRAALVVREVGEALTAIHSQDIVHRDIKPTNIIVTRDAGGVERVKIVDFGIAKAVGGGAGQDLTEPGFVAATVHYAAPELLRGKPGKGSDVYALGVVLYEILTGRRPFEATNQAELFSMILDPGVRPPTLAEARPGSAFPPGLQAVIDRALERDPEKRFSSPTEFSATFVGLVPELAETVRVPVADLPDLDAGAPMPPGEKAPPPPATLPPPTPSSQPPEQVVPPREGPGATAAPVTATPPTSRTRSRPGVAPATDRKAGAGTESSRPSGDGQEFNWRSPKVLWGGVGGIMALGIILFLAFGGGGVFGGGGSASAGGFSVSPASAFLESGDTLAFAASDAEGVISRAGDVRWISQDPEIARIGSPGMVMGGRAGITSVLAIRGGDTADVRIEVSPGPPARVTLMPSALRLAPGEGDRIEASVTDAQGNSILNPGIQWTSNTPDVARVDEGGFVRAGVSGSAVIRATVDEAWNQATVEVRSTPGDPPPVEPQAQGCPGPVMEELDRLEVAMDDPSASKPDLRAGALACWNRGQELSDEERAYAAWLIGLITVDLEDCTPEAIRWLDRAVQLEPESEAYRVARAACGGGQP